MWSALSSTLQVDGRTYVVFSRLQKLKDFDIMQWICRLSTYSFFPAFKSLLDVQRNAFYPESWSWSDRGQIGMAFTMRPSRQGRAHRI